MENKVNIIEDFKKYFFENKEKFEKSDTYNQRKNNMKIFYQEYPFERLKDLSLEEYAIGNQNNNSLCYKLEFGRYKECGPGIGGAFAAKYGIYFSRERNNYIYNKKIENNPEKRWDIIKEDLIKLISNIRDANNVDEINDNYESLKGMSVVIIKLAFCYFPQKVIGVCGRKQLESLLDLFDFEYDINVSSLKLAFLFNDKLRKVIPEINNENPETVAHLVWMYLQRRTKVETENEVKRRFWTFSPGENANKWQEFYNEGIMAIGWDNLGDLTQYSSKEEIRKALMNDRDGTNKNNALANWEFMKEMRIGDIVYAKKGQNTIVGKGIVESDYIFDDSRKEFKSYRKVKWINNEEKKNIKAKIGSGVATKTLTNITRYKDFVDSIEKLYEDIDKIDNSYNKYDFFEDVFLSEEKIDDIINILERKKNIILQGVPGVGKTFCAKKIMYALMNEKDSSRIEMVQFHQSYSYEDFIQGYRPNDEGKFEIKNGIFYRLVSEAREEYETAKIENRAPKKYCMIIDEINRGNLSKIFGELMMLIEADKRSANWEINLTYSDEPFYIPENLYIIGTMNTADRSLAMVDYALRRRFAFIRLEPAFNNEKLRKYLIEREKLSNDIVDNIIDKFIKLNEYIKDNLSKDFVIGHSYFIDQQLDIDNFEDKYNEIINYEIKPLLEEYFYDDEEKINKALDIIKY